MKSLAAVLVFVFALVSAVYTVAAEAAGQVKVEQAFTAPVLLEDDGASQAIAADKKKKKKKDGEDEEDEEDYRLPGAAGAAALELVDPGALGLTARIEAAARLR